MGGLTGKGFAGGSTGVKNKMYLGVDSIGGIVYCTKQQQHNSTGRNDTMKRITAKKLEEAVDYLNEITRLAGNKNAGNYRLSYLVSSYSLHLYFKKTSGCCDVFRCGHVPAKELYHRIHAFIDGFCAAAVK